MKKHQILKGKIKDVILFLNKELAKQREEDPNLMTKRIEEIKSLRILLEQVNYDFEIEIMRKDDIKILEDPSITGVEVSFYPASGRLEKCTKKN